MTKGNKKPSAKQAEIVEQPKAPEKSQGRSRVTSDKTVAWLSARIAIVGGILGIFAFFLDLPAKAINVIEVFRSTHTPTSTLPSQTDSPNSQNLTGTILYHAINGDTRNIVMINASDTENPIVLFDRNAISSFPSWSPDGNAIVFDSTWDPLSGNTDNAHIYLLTNNGNSIDKLTSKDYFDWSPLFSQSGSQILFVSNRGGDNDIYLMDVSGNNVVKVTDNLGDDKDLLGRLTEEA